MRLLPLTINSPPTTYMQMPRWLFNEDIDLSIEAKFLYMLLYDAASVSKKNNHAAADGTLYVWYTLQTVQEKMKCSKKTAIKLFYELEEKGYIQRKKQGLGRPSIIYLFYPEEALTIKTNSAEEGSSSSTTKKEKEYIAAPPAATEKNHSLENFSSYRETKKKQYDEELENEIARLKEFDKSEKQKELERQKQEEEERRKREEWSAMWKERIEFAKQQIKENKNSSL